MPFGKYEDYTIAPSFNDGIATVALLLRNDGLRYVILRFTEGSPGRAKLAEFSLLPLTYFVPKIRSPASPSPGKM